MSTPNPARRHLVALAPGLECLAGRRDDKLVDAIRTEGTASPTAVLITVGAARLEVAHSLGEFKADALPMSELAGAALKAQKVFDRAQWQ